VLEEGGDCVLSEWEGGSDPDHADGLEEGFEGYESGEGEEFVDPMKVRI
jgi:hypothetical protein